MKSFLKFATRLDNLVLVVCLCLFAGVIAFGENGPTPKIVVGSSGISDGSVTPAKISSGYNLLTDAEKTQALTGSSTVNFVAKTVTAENGNFTKKLDIYEETTTLPSLSARTYTSGYFKVGSIYLSATPSELTIASLTKSISFAAGKITLLSSKEREAADIYLPNYDGASPSVIIWQAAGNIFATSDTAGKICIYRGSSNRWVIKNNTGSTTNLFYTLLASGNGASE